MFPFQPRTVLAPMEGVTHPEFRAIIAEKGGVGLLCTEFVRVHGEKVSERHMRRQVEKVPGVPLSVQVMGKEVELMADAARFVQGAGADVVDINLGCPSPKAARGGVGAAMLKDIGLLRSVIAAMREQTEGLLSAKMRAGFDDKAHVLDIAKAIEDAGADFLAIHPRRRVDHYEGVADWRIIGEIRNTVQIPVIGNGDIWCAQDAIDMEQSTRCHAVMIGRAALRNPWIFAQTAAVQAGEPCIRPSGDDVAAYVHEVSERYAARWKGKPFIVMGRLKEMARFLCTIVDDGGALRTAALRSQSLEELVDVIATRMSGLRADEVDLGAKSALAKSGTASLSSHAA